jgi:phosphate transport system substrate-binding protein
MVFLRSTLATLTTLTLGSALLGHTLAPPRSSLVARADDVLEAPVFPIPDQLPANATLVVEGSSTMALANQSFWPKIAERYPTLTLQVTTSSTDIALDKLRRGEIDLAAIGRRITPAEQDQGLVEVPIRREKIALIVGPNNPFSGGLTLDQVAQMFYGEIDNWAALGGPDLPLRFVDRPASSDTRQALGRYPGFAEKGLSPGPTVSPVAEDSTDAVIAALGNDGMGYAVVSQVKDRGDVRLLTVDDVLPTDARYPYSQPRVYVYNSNNPSPSALAFLGVVNIPANLAPLPAVAAPPTTTEAPPSTLPAGANSEAAGSETAAPESLTPLAETPLGAAPSLSTSAAESPLAGDTVQPRPWTDRGQAWGWLIAIPLLGGLLWWLLKTQAQQAETGSPAGTTGQPNGRMVLTPRHCRRAYAYWEVPDALRATQRERGGRTLMLRLLDVTDRDVERHPPSRIDQFPVTEDQQDLHLPIPADDRSYQAELGYITQENHWLSLVKSAAVHVPTCAATLASSSPND